MPRKSHTYHFLYKTTNLINNTFYYGMHSSYKLDDDYLGSGTRLRRSIRKYGKKNFKREILQFFNNRQELIQGEIELITEAMLNDSLCMNLKLGGEGGFKDVEHQKKCTLAANKVNTGASYTKGKVIVKDSTGNTLMVPVTDSRYISGELVHVTKNTVIVKDSDDTYVRISKDDPRYLSGELFVEGRKHSDETKQKISQKSKIHQAGTRNAMYGKHHTEETRRKQANKNSLTFYVYDLEDNFISEESNIKQYALDHNLNSSSIVKVMKGKYSQTGGFKFSYTKK